MQNLNPTQAEQSKGSYGAYLLQIALYLIVIAAGYVLFWQFAADIMPRMESYNLYVLALIAGIASFFSPCAFPLLPSYLAFYGAATENEKSAMRPAQVMGLGLFASAGVITFTLILGAMIGLVGTGIGEALSMTTPHPPQIVLWFRGTIGVLLIGFGAAQWFNINLKPQWVEAFVWRTRPNRASKRKAGLTLYLYGLGYNAAGIGCTGPILAGLTLFALSQGGFQSVLTAFAVFAATSGSLMLVISLFVANSQDTLVQKLKTGTGSIKRVSSIILVLVGVFTLLTVSNRPLFVQSLFPAASPVAASAMGVMERVSMDFAPPVVGLYSGGEVRFIHTEASDPEVAALLGEMMGPEVLYVPRLTKTPDTLLAGVYVFTDGIAGSGPFGFQPDVFDSVPGDTTYSPLRRVNLVAWNDGTTPKLLGDIGEIEAAAAADQVTIDTTNIVINMPILLWPGGQR